MHPDVQRQKNLIEASGLGLLPGIALAFAIGVMATGALVLESWIFTVAVLVWCSAQPHALPRSSPSSAMADPQVPPTMRSGGAQGAPDGALLGVRGRADALMATEPSSAPPELKPGKRAGPRGQLRTESTGSPGWRGGACDVG